MWFQFIMNAFIASAFSSGIRNTYIGYLWLRCVANRSMLGNCVMRKMTYAMLWLRDHSVEIGLFTLEKQSARMMNFPEMCMTKSIIVFFFFCFFVFFLFVVFFVFFWQHRRVLLFFSWQHRRVFQTSRQTLRKHAYSNRLKILTTKK